MGRKPTDIVQLTLRLREDLRRKLERAADKAERSLNIEIIERLEASFAAEAQAQQQSKMILAIETSNQRLLDELKGIKSTIGEIAKREGE
jgi:Arc-like DNA binding domain